jgi:hypothetical protein
MELVSCHSSGAEHLNLFLVRSFLHLWAWPLTWELETVHGYENGVSVTVCSVGTGLLAVVTHEIATKCSVLKISDVIRGKLLCYMTGSFTLRTGNKVFRLKVSERMYDIKGPNIGAE